MNTKVSSFPVSVPRETVGENRSEAAQARSVRNLFAAVNALVHDSEPQTPKGIASDAGVGYGYLLKAADERQQDVQFQTRWVAPVTLAAKNDVLIQFLARECGGVFVRLLVGGSNDAHTAKTLQEVAQYFTKLAELSGDGYSHAEVDVLEAEWQDAAASALAHLRKLRSEAK